MNKLKNDINDSITAIDLAFSNDFPSRGFVQIGTEVIQYDYTADRTLLNCTRGAFGSSAASHSANDDVSLYIHVTTVAEENSIIELLSPGDLPTDIVDQADIIQVTTVMADNLSLTLQSPSNSAPGRVLTVAHKSGSAGSLSVNGTSLAAGESKIFVWDTLSWTSAPTSGGGGVTFPLIVPDDGEIATSGIVAGIDFGGVSSPTTALEMFSLHCSINFDDVNDKIKMVIAGTEVFSIKQLTLNLESDSQSSITWDDTTPGSEFLRVVSGQYVELYAVDHLLFTINGVEQGRIVNGGYTVRDNGSFADATLAYGMFIGGVTAPTTAVEFFSAACDLTMNDTLGLMHLSAVGNGKNAQIFLGTDGPDGTADGCVTIQSSSGAIGNAGDSHPNNAAQFDHSVTARETRFIVYDVDSGALQRVTVGDADSGGTGFKLLRIPN